MKLLKKIWEIKQEEMLPNILLMCKFLWLILIINGFFYKLNDPFLPFISYLDFFNQYPGIFKNSLRFMFILSGIMLLLNIKVRWNSVILGSIIIIGILASKPIFQNHVLIVGCILFLSGIANKLYATKLLVFQMSLLYLAAALSKMSDMDWWSGQFMHNWLYNATTNPFYITISEFISAEWMSKFLSWSSILMELTIGIILLVPKFRTISVWLIILFHGLLFSFVGHKFGHFVDDIFIILLAFLSWPKNNLTVKQFNFNSFYYMNLIKVLDWNKSVIWNIKNDNKSNTIEVIVDDNIEINKLAVRSLLKYSVGFYYILFVLNMLLNFIDNFILRYALFSLIMWSLIAFFIPIEIFIKKKESKIF